MNRFRDAQRNHLRPRLRQQAGRGSSELWSGGKRIAADLVVVPTDYRKVVKLEEETPTKSGMHVWLIGVDQVQHDYREADELYIEGQRYRVVRDDITDSTWQPIGHSEAMRAVFTVEVGPV